MFGLIRRIGKRIGNAFSRKRKSPTRENPDAKFLAAFKIVENKWMQFARHYPEAIQKIRKNNNLELQFIQALIKLLRMLSPPFDTGI